MDIHACIKKIYPDWNGVVWENKHEGIVPDDSEHRPIPTMEELQTVWPQVQADMENANAKRELASTDAVMARIAEDIFDVLVAQGMTFPQVVKDKITQRKALRARV